MRVIGFGSNQCIEDDSPLLREAYDWSIISPQQRPAWFLGVVRVATPSGPIAVQDLSLGDSVITKISDSLSTATVKAVKVEVYHSYELVEVMKGIYVTPETWLWVDNSFNRAVEVGSKITYGYPRRLSRLALDTDVVCFLSINNDYMLVKLR